MDVAADIVQTAAGALKLAGWWQALENPEQFTHVAHVEADAVVADKKKLLAVAGIRAADLNFRQIARPGVFDRVGDQIDPHLTQHGRVGPNFGQLADLPRDMASFGFRLK